MSCIFSLLPGLYCLLFARVMYFLGSRHTVLTVFCGPMGMVVFMLHVSVSSRVLLSSPRDLHSGTLPGNLAASPAVGLSVYSGKANSIPVQIQMLFICISHCCLCSIDLVAYTQVSFQTYQSNKTYRSIRIMGNSKYQSLRVYISVSESHPTQCNVTLARFMIQKLPH